MGMFGERIDRETPELDEEGVRMRFIGRRGELDAELQARMDGAEAETAGNDRITPLRRLQLRRPGEIVDAARRFAAECGPDAGEDEFAQPPLRARDARPRPGDPHQRRAAALQLPALAVRLLGAGLLRRALARLRARGPRGSLAEYGRRQRRFGGR